MYVLDLFRSDIRNHDNNIYKEEVMKEQVPIYSKDGELINKDIDAGPSETAVEEKEGVPEDISIEQVIVKRLDEIIDLLQTLIISGPLKNEYESFIKCAAEVKDLDEQRDKERTDRENKRGT
tara:strand:- start:139 stop:504 length:366 start_codon:yes stop_codon:yes gene_type:complete